MAHHNPIKRFLMHITFAEWAVTGILILLIAAAGAGGWYAYDSNQRIDTLHAQVTELSDSLASTTALLQTNIKDSHSALAKALSDEQARISTVQNQLGSVQGQVGSLDNNVSTLTKLTTTDKELLAKYSKVYFLNENYQPARLTEIPSQYKYYDTRDMQIVPQVLPYLEKMLSDAKAAGIDIYVDSAYRSFASQQNIKNNYDVVYGAGTANQFSADQGYSEHQLGTAVDLMTTGINGELTDAFANTQAYTWLQNNAYKYGFELSYPKGNSYYIFEPWHWRFVGVKLATDLHTQGKYFYDLDQRTIDTYLPYLFD